MGENAAQIVSNRLIDALAGEASVWHDKGRRDAAVVDLCDPDIPADA